MSDNKLLQELKAEVAELRAVAHNANDIESIRKLQHQYGYYLDKCLYQQVVDLFDDNGSITFHGGIYRGKAGLKRLYLERFRKGFTNGRNGPVHGYALSNLELTTDSSWIISNSKISSTSIRIDISPRVVGVVLCKLVGIIHNLNQITSLNNGGNMVSTKTHIFGIQKPISGRSTI
jgi:hypothetical protein